MEVTESLQPAGGLRLCFPKAQGSQATRFGCRAEKKDSACRGIRHTTATHLLRAGLDINTIRAWLGHVSLNTTNVYAGVDLEMHARTSIHRLNRAACWLSLRFNCGYNIRHGPYGIFWRDRQGSTLPEGVLLRTLGLQARVLGVGVWCVCGVDVPNLLSARKTKSMCTNLWTNCGRIFEAGTPCKCDTCKALGFPAFPTAMPRGHT
jgi:Phage integrase family